MKSTSFDGLADGREEGEFLSVSEQPARSTLRTSPSAATISKNRCFGVEQNIIIPYSGQQTPSGILLSELDQFFFWHHFATVLHLALLGKPAYSLK